MVNRKGDLQGILSMDDIIVRAKPSKLGEPSGLSYDDVMGTLKRIYLPETLLATQGRVASA